MEFADDDLTPGQLMDINNYFIERNEYTEMTFLQLEKKPLWRYRENYIDIRVLRQMYGLTVGRLNLN